jgi:hypothetical protein
MKKLVVKFRCKRCGEEFFEKYDILTDDKMAQHRVIQSVITNPLLHNCYNNDKVRAIADCIYFYFEEEEEVK